ncbi:MAG: acyl carrier protein [Gemmatimonadales bacterium]
MPADPSLVASSDLTDALRSIVAQVLMVPPGDVHPETALYSLGAESIDYLDLIFRIEEAIGKKVPVSRWEAFVRERLPGADLTQAITVAIVVEFAERERARV